MVRSLGVALSFAALALGLATSGQAQAAWVGSPTLPDMSTPRMLHGVVRLADGRVLVVGGDNVNNSCSAADLKTTAIFDPRNETWTAGGNTVSARAGMPIPVLLNSGKVLVAGGCIGGVITAKAEIYDPAANTWSSTDDMSASRSGLTLTLLPSGKVLAAGGYSGSGGPVASAELYDPTTGHWAATGTMHQARSGQTTTVLPNGTVLVAGGFSNDGGGTTTTSAELYDPVTGLWANTGSLTTGRFGHIAALVTGGKVIVAGGETVLFGGLSSTPTNAEIYDPASGLWSSAGTLSSQHGGATGGALSDGRAIIVGGYANGLPTAATEVYDPSTNSWSSAGTLNTARNISEGVPLPDGGFLSFGGIGPGSSTVLASVEGLDAGPNTTVDSGPSGTLSQTTAEFTFSSTTSGVGFACRLDAGSWTACNSGSMAYPSLADGSHTFEVRAVDPAGATDLTPAARSWAVKTVPPTVSLTAPGNGTSTTTPIPTLSGGAGTATGDLPTITVNLYSGSSASGSPVQTLTTTASGPSWSIQVSSALADGIYTGVAQQSDAASNIGVSLPTTFAVHRSPPIAVISGPAMVLTGQSLSFSASGSSDTYSTLDDYSWDFDGSNSFSQDAGNVATVGHTFPTPGIYVVDLRVHDSAGFSAVAHVTVDVRPVPPSGNVGVSINNGDYATNNPRVRVGVVWPRFASQLLISNDGGFGPAGSTVTVSLSPQIPWTLEQTGPERLPKTVYVRFLGAGIDLQNFTDDIILDQRPPALQSVSLVGSARAAGAATAATAKSAPGRGPRTYRIRIKASDTIAGVCAVDASRTRSTHAVTTITNCHRKGVLRLSRIVRVKATAKPHYVRVRNSAGTWSRWLKLK